MARTFIVFEDTGNKDVPIGIGLFTDREDDCQDEPTLAEAAALQFFSAIEDLVKQANESE